LRALLLLALALPALAYDPSLTKMNQITAIGAGNGGEIACQHGAIASLPTPGTRWCAWNSNQAVTGSSGPIYEIFDAPGNESTGGTWQPTGSIVCVTCATSGSNNLDISLFGASAANTVNKGTPYFDPTNNFLVIDVSQPSFTSVSSCLAANAIPGVGICFYPDIMQFNQTTGAISNGVPLVTLTSGIQGALYARFGCGLIWMSYRFGGVAGGSGATGSWEIRAFQFALSGAGNTTITVGSEVTSVATASAAAYPNAYMEASGFCDAATGRFVFQAATGSTSGAAGQNYWNNAILTINAPGSGQANEPATGSATIDTLIATTSGGCLDWLEHMTIDTSLGWLFFSSSHTAPATTYSACATTFVSVPLERWKTTLSRGVTSTGAHLYADASHAIQLTDWNTASPDRTAMCIVQLGVACTGTHLNTAISASYSDTDAQGQGVTLVKVGQGNGTDYSYYDGIQTRLLGSAKLLHAGKLVH
jgi:hypothetical protein